MASNTTTAKAQDAADIKLESPFAHLHLHSEYSLLDGGNRVDKLIARVKELGMTSVALTDHGNLFGAMAFYREAKAQGIKPILGIEAYVAHGDRTDKNFKGSGDGGFHLVLLARNMQGWKNLLKLSSDAYVNGFYFKPRMDKSTLEKYKDGLIAINGHLGSSLAYHLTQFVQSKDPSHYKAAVEEAKWHAKNFGPDENGKPSFYLEIQRHETPEQDVINPHILSIAKELNLPVVCDNDAHFLMADDHDAHDSLCCISMGKNKDDPNRLRYPKQLYVKAPQQMIELFSDVPEAITNSADIASRCNVDISFKENHAPVVKIERVPSPDGDLSQYSEGSTPWFKAFCGQYELLPFDSENDTTPEEELKIACDKALRELSEAGAVWRYGPSGVDDEKRARLERELKVLADKGISAYFLIVWDFVNDARRKGIPCNARGSGVGTMVGYCLGLSNACPVEYGLLFERFTDPDRSEYPDIDIDICQDGRQDIIEYVRQKYGHVAQIITFGTLKARAAIRDVGRVHNMPLPDVDKLCKLIGDGLGTTISQALKQETELRSRYETDHLTREVIDTSIRLEGLSRHAGVHAAGVIIATQPLDNIVPLYKPPGQDLQIVTQWDGPTCEKVGLLKMDFLGLRTLSIIERAKLLIRQSLSTKQIRATVGLNEEDDLDNDPLDLERLKYTDQKVLDLFRRGETAGVFQFESGGMRNLLMSMKPDRLEDLIAANALYRPGPMDLIPDYNARKHGKQPVPKLHEVVSFYTNETYGIMIYQEQVMQIVHGLGGIPLRAAYTLIKAISKKSQKAIDEARVPFVAGAAEKGMTKDAANELYDLILKFAGYGFNKSHSTGYAIVAYQTAYLKTFFPVQYMAAVLTYESVSTEKVVEYIDECRRVKWPDGHRGISVKPPDINLSEVGFAVVFEPGETRDANHGHIRFGLSAVKGVGEKAIQAIIAVREKDGPFKDLYEFCERLPAGAVNKSTMEALIKCGAFDSLHGTDKRAAMLEALEAAMQAGQRTAAARDAGQLSFFDSFAAAAPAAEAAKVSTLPSTEPWPTVELLKQEKSVLGFYISSHPLDQYRDELARFANVSIADSKSLAADTQVIIGGMLTRVRPTLVKNGRSAGSKMAMITIEDKTGAIDGVIFSDAYAVAAPLVEADRMIFLRGMVDRRREEPSIVVEKIIDMPDAPSQLTTGVNIVLEPDLSDSDAAAAKVELSNLKSLLRQSGNGHGGASAQVYFEVRQQGHVARFRAPSTFIAVSKDLPDRIDTVLRRRGSCQLIGPPRLLTKKTAAKLMHDENSEPQQPLLRRNSQGEEVCASIDRY